MTVSAQTPINRSAGNGVTTVFPYTFKIIAAGDIEVSVDNFVKTLNVDYTVTGAGVDGGGNVTMTVAPASGTTVVRRRNMAFVRTTDYQDQGALPAATLDNDIDAPVMMIQQLDERLDRTFSLPASSSANSTMPAPTAGYVIGWDALGESLTNLPAAVGTSLIDLAASGGSSLVGYLPAGTGAVATDVQSKLRESVSLKDYGAVGDGTTDDYAAIMAAHTALPSTGGEIKTGRGVFKHNTALVFTKRIKLVGEGTNYYNETSQSEFLKSSAISGDGVVFSGGGSIVDGVAFRGQVGNAGDGVVIKAARVTLRDVSAYQMGADGVRVGTDAGNENCNMWVLDNVKTKSNGRHGVYISEGATASSDASGGTAIHVDSQSNVADGFVLGSCQLNTLVGVSCQNNGAYGLRFSANARSNIVFGGDLEGSALAELRLDSGAVDNAIYCYTLLNSAISDASGANSNRIEGIDINRLACGISFPSVRVVSTDPRTIDDYLEGVFTPTIVGATSAGVGTYTTQVGSYVKVGALVTVQIYLVWTAHTGTGNMRIGGLPYSAASASTYGYASANIGLASNIALTASNVLTAYVNSGTNTMDMVQYPVGGGAATNVPIDAAGTLMLTASYREL